MNGSRDSLKIRCSDVVPVLLKPMANILRALDPARNRSSAPLVGAGMSRSLIMTVPVRAGNRGTNRRRGYGRSASFGVQSSYPDAECRTRRISQGPQAGLVFRSRGGWSMVLCARATPWLREDHMKGRVTRNMACRGYPRNFGGANRPGQNTTMPAARIRSAPR